MVCRMNRSKTPDQKWHREQHRTKTDSPVLVVAHWSRQPADVIPGRFLHVLGQFKMFRSDTMQAGCHVNAENISSCRQGENGAAHSFLLKSRHNSSEIEHVGR